MSRSAGSPAVIEVEKLKCLRFSEKYFPTLTTSAMSDVPQPPSPSQHLPHQACAEDTQVPPTA